mgnify:FL=1
MVSVMGGPPKTVARITFDKYDSDGDGSLNKEELHNYCYNMGHCMDGETFEAAFLILDANGTGVVSYENFLDWWKKDDRWAHLQLTCEQLTALSQVHEYFRYFDTECEGYLDHTKFSACYEYMVQSGYALKEFASSLSEIDTNNDGVVNYNELVHWMISMGVLNIDKINPVALVQQE